MIEEEDDDEQTLVNESLNMEYLNKISKDLDDKQSKPQD